MKIKDVIHGEILIEEPIIIDLIHTKEFQRLRKIKQLGLTNLNFPSAEHTRFSHSIGVYHLTKLIVNNFKKSGKQFFTFEEEQGIIIAALLHDLGHGPLSHAAEMFFNYSHEEYTNKIIQNEQTQVHKVLKKFEAKNNISVIEHVIKFISKTHSNKALNSILSSSLDADRMDYLLRDSYHTGVVYGAVDIQRILLDLDYFENKIILSEKVVHTLEDFILSRYHMFVQVYLNEKNIYYELLIQKILQRVFLLYDKKFEFKNDISILLDLTEYNIDIQSYVNINDYNFLDLIMKLQNENDETLKILVNLFETQKLFDYSSLVKNKEYKESENANLNSFYLEIAEYSKKVYNSEEPIYIQLSNNSKVVPIEEISPIFKFAKEELEITLKNKQIEIKYKEEDE